MRFWWQNLNEKPGGRIGLPTHGRCRWWLGGLEIGLEWSVPSHFCHANLYVDPHDDVTLGLATPLAALWLKLGGRKVAALTGKLVEGYEPREIGIKFHDGSIWWDVWHTAWSWSYNTPRWQHGNFNFLDFLLGKWDYSERELSVHQVEIPMPERSYPAKVTMFESTWERPRWFPTRMVSAKVDMEVPIPIPGKGENSWDCGDDAIYGQTSPVDTVEKAIASVVEGALSTRKRHGGSHKWSKEPK